MREIKFRAWDKRSKRMITKPFIYFKTEEISITWYGNGCYIVVNENNFEIMQYTGLKDKNGKEIYEEDLIIHNGNKYFVYYSDDLAMFIFLPVWRSFKSWLNDEESDPCECMLWDLMSPEIIGNKYENPELLK